MKQFLTKLFSPILNIFEDTENQEEFAYSPSHRKILVVMGVLFLMISAVALYFSLLINQMAGFLPVILFGAIGLLCLLVGYLGSDYAVSKIWRNRY